MPVPSHDALGAKAVPDRLRLHLRDRTRLRSAVCGDAAVKRYRPSLEERADEVIQDHLDGMLREVGPQARRPRRRLTPKPSIIYEAVRRKLRGGNV